MVGDTEKKEAVTEAFDYDKILDHIGQFGTFQRKIFFWLSFVSGAAGLAVVAFAFIGFEPQYRCRVPECEAVNSSYYAANGQLPKFYSNNSLTLAHRCSLPRPTNQMLSPLKMELCSEYSMTFPDDEELGFSTCDSSYLVFDKSVLEQSLVEEFGFVCDRANLRTFYNAIYMLGMLFGSFLFGWISDHHGRLNSLLLAVITVSLSGFFGAFCGGRWGQYGYGLLRLLTGMGGIGCFMVSFVLAVEHVGTRFTSLIGVAIEIPFAIGQVVLGLESYLVRDWRVLQILAHLPLLALTGIYWVVPESVRWLIANGRIREANEIIILASSANKLQAPEELLHQIDGKKSFSLMEKRMEATKTSLFRVYSNKKIFGRTLNMCFQWFSVTMCYYGLAFASTSLSGDPFTNFFLNVLVDIPGYLFCMVVMECWGRRPILSLCQLVAGLSCIGCAFLQGTTDSSLQQLSVILSLIGKFGASAVWGIVFVYTAEMFPTVIRNQAVGTCSLVARIGGIISMLLDLLKVYWLPAPVFIMGVVATFAGVLAVLFPETLGEKLPETLDDAIRIGTGKNRSFFSCSCRNLKHHCGGDAEEFEQVSSTDGEDSES